jgi:hypothetical protein
MENLMQLSDFMDKLANLGRFVGELTRAIQKISDKPDIFNSNHGHLTCVKLIEQICYSIKILTVQELLNVFSSTMLAESMVKSGQKSGFVDDTMIWGFGLHYHYLL